MRLANVSLDGWSYIKISSKNEFYPSFEKAQKVKKLQTLKKGLQRDWLVSLARFERATFRLGGECSIQLSYRDKQKMKGQKKRF